MTVMVKVKAKLRQIVASPIHPGLTARCFLPMSHGDGDSDQKQVEARGSVLRCRFQNARVLVIEVEQTRAY